MTDLLSVFLVQIVALDRKRNANREALNALRKNLTGDGKLVVVFLLAGYVCKCPSDFLEYSQM